MCLGAQTDQLPTSTFWTVSGCLVSGLLTQRRRSCGEAHDLTLRLRHAVSVGSVRCARRLSACARPNRATHNARSHLALSRFSSGRPAPAPRCKGISLHLAAPCTEVQRTSLYERIRLQAFLGWIRNSLSLVWVVWSPFPLSMDHRWKDALNNLHKLSVLELPGILGILES